MTEDIGDVDETQDAPDFEVVEDTPFGEIPVERTFSFSAMEPIEMTFGKGLVMLGAGIIVAGLLFEIMDRTQEV